MNRLGVGSRSFKEALQDENEVTLGPVVFVLLTVGRPAGH
jgi:hypothetical protein